MTLEARIRGEILPGLPERIDVQALIEQSVVRYDLVEPPPAEVARRVALLDVACQPTLREARAARRELTRVDVDAREFFGFVLNVIREAAGNGSASSAGNGGTRTS